MSREPRPAVVIATVIVAAVVITGIVAVTITVDTTRKPPNPAKDLRCVAAHDQLDGHTLVTVCDTYSPQPGRPSRSHTRPPLPETEPTVTPRRSPVRRAHVANGSGGLAVTTMYCRTGSRNAAGRWPRLGDVAVLDRSIPFGTRIRIAGRTYLAEDWIGHGSSFDIFGGNDAGCEQRALDFGRQYLRVAVER